MVSHTVPLSSCDLISCTCVLRACFTSVAAMISYMRCTCADGVVYLCSSYDVISCTFRDGVLYLCNSYDVIACACVDCVLCVCRSSDVISCNILYLCGWCPVLFSSYDVTSCSCVDCAMCLCSCWCKSCTALGIIGDTLTNRQKESIRSTLSVAFYW